MATRKKISIKKPVWFNDHYQNPSRVLVNEEDVVVDFLLGRATSNSGPT